MNPPRVVAIDGAAGSGKSTLARALARHLHLAYINTGLMYRALAAAAAERGIPGEDAPRLTALARELRFTVVDGELHVEGSDADFTSAEVEATVSQVAAHEAVRGVLRARQRALGADGAVMEGRDIGSVVFVDAPLKLFLVADPRARARRRAAERGAFGREADGEVEAALHDRDVRDARTVAHVPAPGSEIIDTGSLDEAATLEAALACVRRSAPELLP